MEKSSFTQKWNNPAIKSLKTLLPIETLSIDDYRKK